jgi:hypothetical protein
MQSPGLRGPGDLCGDQSFFTSLETLAELFQLDTPADTNGVPLKKSGSFVFAHF